MPFRGSTARTAAAEAPIRPSLPRAAALPRAGSTRANAARPSLRGPRRAGRGARGLTRSPRRSQPPPPPRPPSVSASPERAGSPRPRALPRAGLTAHVGPGRAALAAAPGTARHGTARRGGRGGRRGGGLRCALPAPPRWKEAVPGERWAPARLSLLFYDHQFSPLVRAGRLAAAFTLIGVIKSKGITLAKSFRRIYFQMNRSAHGTAGGARRSGPEPPGTARPRVRRLQCL